MVVSGENKELADGSTNACTNACTDSPDSVQIGPELQRVAAAMSGLSEGDRADIAAHVEALAVMSPARRAAILTLTRPEERP